MVNISTHLDYKVSQLNKIVNGQLLSSSSEDRLIEHILLDSRQVIYPASSLFIALKGRQSDGHNFLKEIYAKGTRAFLVSRLPKDLDNYQDAAFIEVKDTQEAFHQIASFHRRRFHLEVVGITGSNGKTIVKEWLHQLLYVDFDIVRSPRSFNSQTGVPLSVLQINEHHQLGLFEAGISLPGEMEKLERILLPNVVILTNIGTAHSEGFETIEAKLKEKLILCSNASTIIFREDNLLINDTAKEVARTDQRLFTWSLNKKHNGSTNVVFKLEKQLENSAGQLIEVSFSEKNLLFQVLLPFIDEASIENACHCISFMLFKGYERGIIRESIEKLEPVGMRLELKEGINECTVINDSYNSDLTSLSIALDFLDQQNTSLRKTLIISDLLQSGMNDETLYHKVSSLIEEKSISKLIGIGPHIVTLNGLLSHSIEQYYFDDTTSFLDEWDKLTFFRESILLKGARQFEFERIANRLSSRVHNTVMEVNMGALLHNLRIFQGHLNPGTRLMVMVKAGAYGSGSVEVAKMLEFQHVDYLGVAYADEGVELRNKGIQLPIMVMNPEVSTFDSLVRYHLEPEIYSLKLLQDLIKFLEGGSDRDRLVLGIHLKLDTGMHRLGFEESEIETLIGILKNNDRIKMRSIFSHLAASDEIEQDDFTKIQINNFQKLYERIASELGYRPIRHILNSSGIVRFPNYQMDMVRLGIGLYGVDSSHLVSDKLQVVNTLKATISQIKHIRPGETVGYGRRAVAENPMTIATISIGYADGLLRKAGNGNYFVLVNGVEAPLVGNVCMDMTMIDVSSVANVSAGDEVIIFGKKPSVELLAQAMGTIPYEVFTSVSRRVKRIYVQE